MSRQANLRMLGYQQNWLDFGFLTEELLTKQIYNFEHGNDKNTEHFRYATFLDFIQRYNNFTDLQVQNFITLTEKDSDRLMAGSALKALFLSDKLTVVQVEMIKLALMNFGSWTAKVIEQHRLMTALTNTPLTPNLMQACIAFKQTYQSNVLLEAIIKKTVDKAILEQFTTMDYGKTIRNLANQKLKQLRIQ